MRQAAFLPCYDDRNTWLRPLLPSSGSHPENRYCCCGFPRQRTRVLRSCRNDSLGTTTRCVGLHLCCSYLRAPSKSYVCFPLALGRGSYRVVNKSCFVSPLSLLLSQASDASASAATLEKALEKETFLAGQRVTLADIAVCCQMVGQSEGLPPSVARWMGTCLNQPHFK